MGPRGFTLPAAQTASAKAARSAFFCDLCQKGYTRMNEYEAHESSYDHQHKKRLKEMKEMQRQVQPKKEEKGPLVQIKLGGMGKSAGGFKKGGFKSAFGPADDGVGKNSKEEPTDRERVAAEAGPDNSPLDDEDSDVTDDDYYDPRKPTGCMPGCKGKTTMG